MCLNFINIQQSPPGNLLINENVPLRPRVSCVFTSVSYKVRPYLDTEGEGPGQGEEDEQRAQAGQHAGARPGPGGVSCKHERVSTSVKHTLTRLCSVTLIFFLQYIKDRKEKFK